MTDENANTADLTADEKLDRILAELVEKLSDIREEMRDVRKELRSIDRTFPTFASDHTRMRADIRDFDERLTELERKPN